MNLQRQFLETRLQSRRTLEMTPATFALSGLYKSTEEPKEEDEPVTNEKT